MFIFYIQYEKQSAELTFQLDQLSDRLEEAVGSSTTAVSFSSIHIRTWLNTPKGQLESAKNMIAILVVKLLKVEQSVIKTLVDFCIFDREINLTIIFKCISTEIIGARWSCGWGNRWSILTTTIVKSSIVQKVRLPPPLNLVTCIVKNKW